MKTEEKRIFRNCGSFMTNDDSYDSVADSTKSLSHLHISLVFKVVVIVVVAVKLVIRLTAYGNIVSVSVVNIIKCEKFYLVRPI